MQRRISRKPGSEIAGMPASETRTTTSPRSIRCASSVARGASLPSWIEISGGAGRMPSLSSRPPVRRVSSQAM